MLISDWSSDVCSADLTVYGLAADATDSNAVAAIYAAKGRPSFNPLIVHVADREMAGRLAEFSPVADRLAERFWPGALTLVLPARADGGLSPLDRKSTRLNSSH